jgi:hypothetical protein
VTPVSYPIEGVSALVADPRLVASQPKPEELAATVAANLSTLDELRHQVTKKASEFSYPYAAARLVEAYSEPA